MSYPCPQCHHKDGHHSPWCIYRSWGNGKVKVEQIRNGTCHEPEDDNIGLGLWRGIGWALVINTVVAGLILLFFL